MPAIRGQAAAEHHECPSDRSTTPGRTRLATRWTSPATLVIGTDPVAADTIGQTVLDAMRLEKSLKPITPEPGLVLQHRLAAEKGLGINNLEYIDVVRPVVM